MKKLLFTMLSAAMVLSMAACNTTPGEPAADTAPPADTSVSQAEPAETETENAPESSEDEAWKNEPAYGTTLNYFYDGGNCTAAPYIADVLGYYEEAGLDVSGYASNSYTEALGTNKAQLAVGHISTMLVPATNGVDLSFVAGAHISCKTLYVLGDSDYNSTSDMLGQKVSAPNGIGASDYNILARLFDKDGINPLTDINIVQVETSACVTAMQNGEIAGALLSDTFAYNMVKDGTLRPVRSLMDEDFQHEACCVVAMNATFVKENPITSKKITECLKKAGEWMRNNPEEAVQMLLDGNKISGDYDMNVELWKTLQFGLTDEFTENGLEEIVTDYIRLGLITAYDDPAEVMSFVWTPTAPEAE